MADGSTGLGKLIATDDKGRDAVHVAIAPVTASEKLFPGQGIVLADGSQTHVKAAADEWTGIVDPFLTAAVFPGQRFWMWMRPGSITSLRHEWTHPALDKSPTAVARDAVEALGRQLGLTFDGVMEAAQRFQEGGRQLVEHHFESMSMPDDFWGHYEVLTGRKVNDRDAFFHCGGC